MFLETVDVVTGESSKNLVYVIGMYAGTGVGQILLMRLEHGYR
ncbi:MAG: hypothetical protein ACLR43_13915 [Faecalibacillus faecis]